MRIFRYVTHLRRWWKRHGHELLMEFFISFCLVTAVGLVILKIITLTSGQQCRRELVKVIHKRFNVSEIPLVFVTGTSMTAIGLIAMILNYHPQLRHWKHASIMVNLVNLRYTSYSSKVESKRLRQAGVSIELYDSAIFNVWRHILEKYNPSSPKPMFAELNSLQSSSVTSSMFPYAKFLFVVRDGRAVIYDNHGKNGEKFNTSFYKKQIKKWNEDSEIMYMSCNKLGRERCLMVSYEDVLLDAKEEIIKLFNFFELNSTMSNEVLTTNQPVKDLIYAKEPNSIPELVVRMKNTGTLWKWVKYVPRELRNEMELLAPMLQVLGYDPFYYPKTEFRYNSDNKTQVLYE